ncbi:MAG: hypothetical protein P1P86_16005 [Bacteroidales bacterium]|nr:hypothetical protein [Bacteroidales bacterium]
MKYILKPGIIGCLLILTIFQTVQAQEYFRVNADFTVKIKRADGTMNLTRGSVYYDKNIQELIYRVSFPQPEVWVIADTSLFKFRSDTLYDRISIPSVNEFTVFHLSLNSGISDFGMKRSRFKVSRVEKKNDLVLSYWKIPDQAEISIDHVVVAKKDNRLESVIMVGDESKVLSRQFYRNYMKSGAFEFPQQIVQILPGENGEENYQVTEFKNIKVNDMENDELFRHHSSSVK